MLRIKRAVQASYNTEASFVAAQTAAVSNGTEKPTDAAETAAKDAADPMAAMERSMAKGGPAFVASTLRTTTNNVDAEVDAGQGEGQAVNPDAIAMDDDEF
jgi:pre-mRNA-splicing factor SYF1